MTKMHPKLKLTRFPVISGICATLVALSIPVQPAAARTGADFRACAYYLQQSGIPAEESAVACAASLYPRDIGKCVSRIDRETDIAPLDALYNCRRVRRPEEMATCVVQISRFTTGADNASLLDSCRRALLPKRLSQCVVGLSRQTDLPTGQLINTCVDGSDRPRDFYPVLTVPEQRPISPVPGAPPPLAPAPGIPQI